MTLLELVQAAELFLIGYLVVDRVLARRLTGSWLGVPQDVDRTEGGGRDG